MPQSELDLHTTRPRGVPGILLALLGTDLFFLGVLLIADLPWNQTLGVFLMVIPVSWVLVPVLVAFFAALLPERSP